MANAEDDAELDACVRRTLAGDLAAREELFLRVLPVLRAFVRLRCPPQVRRREAASDIVQSACREALDHLAGYAPRQGSSFRAWLLKITGNKVLEKLRRQRAQRRDVRREVNAADPGLDALYRSVATPSQLLSQREEVARFEAAFDQLVPEHQEIILWSRIAGLSHQEIAERMRRSEVAVRSLLSRALARLATLTEPPRG